MEDLSSLLSFLRSERGVRGLEISERPLVGARISREEAAGAAAAPVVVVVVVEPPWIPNP